MGTVRRALGAVAIGGRDAAALAAPARRRSSRAPTPEPNAAVTIAPRPCALETDDPYEKKMYELEGWEAPELRALPGQVPADALRLRADPRQARPERRADRAGQDREAAAGRLHHALQAEPGAARRDGAAGRAGAPAPRHLAVRSPSTAAARSSPPARRRRSRRSRAGSACRSRRPTPGCCSTWSTRPCSSRWRCSSPTTSTSSRRPTARRLGMKPAYPVWLDVRPSGYPVFNVQRDYGGADGVCTWPREECAAHDPFGQKFIGQGKPGNGKGEDLELPKEGEEFGRIGHVQRRHAHRHRRPPAPRRADERDRPGAPRRRAGHATVAQAQVHAREDAAQQERQARRGKKRCKIVRRKVKERKDTVRIYTGEAEYWDCGRPEQGRRPADLVGLLDARDRPARTGASTSSPATSCAATRPTTRGSQSTYENMGIAVSLFVPNDEDGKPQAPGVNPFQAKADHVERLPVRRHQGAAKPRLCDTRRADARPLQGERATTAARRATWNAPARARRPTTSGSSTSSTTPATCR